MEPIFGDEPPDEDVEFGVLLSVVDGGRRVTGEVASRAAKAAAHSISHNGWLSWLVELVGLVGWVGWLGWWSV